MIVNCRKLIIKTFHFKELKNTSFKEFQKLNMFNYLYKLKVFFIEKSTNKIKLKKYSLYTHLFIKIQLAVFLL